MFFSRYLFLCLHLEISSERLLNKRSELISFVIRTNLLNKRSELISKCRHKNKYLLINKLIRSPVPPPKILFLRF